MKIASPAPILLHAVVAALVLAAVYGIMGKLSLLLAIPPGYSTAIWPPSGIALAGVLVYGARVGPGIWLGSFVVNSWSTFDAATGAALLTSLLIPTAIGAGATLQALAGAFLVRRGVGFPTALNHEREILLFLLLGGPVSCLVSASVGVTTLIASGQIPWATFPLQWGTWWVGDTLGVLIVTPLVLSWLAEPRPLWRRRRLSVALPLAGALVLAVGVFAYTSAQERERLRLLFERQATTVAHLVQHRLDTYLDVLVAVESYSLSAGGLSRHALHTFVQRALARHPGLQAVSWDRRVPDTLREAYEQALRQEGYPDFQITEQTADGQLVRAARRPEYVVVSSIEPSVGNERALGFDVASAPDRRDALQRARETGQPSATGRLRLVQEPGRQLGVLVFLPLYGSGLPPATAAERWQNLDGYVTGVFQIDEMVDAALQDLDRDGIALRIEDEAAPPGQRVLYASSGRAQSGSGQALDEARGEEPIGMRWETVVELAGRRWTLRVAPTLTYLAARQSLQPWVVLSGGLVFTSLLGTFLLVATGRTAIIEQLVAERTAQLAVSQRAEERFRVAVEAAPNAMLMVDQAGTIVLVNARVETVFGYPRADLLGQPIERLVPARYRGQHPQNRTAFFAAPRARPMGAGRDLYGLHKDGHEIPVEIGLTPLTLEQASYVLASVVDLTARQQAEAIRAQLAAIVESSDDAIIGKTLEGTIVSWNAGAERMYGYTRAEAQGRPITLLVPPNRPDEVLTILERFRQGERIEQYETVRRRKDGTLLDVSLTISPILDAVGSPVGASTIARDITARKEAEAAIRALNEILEQRVTERTAQLEAANQELVHEMAEHTRAEEALRVSERKFRSVIESATDAIVIADSAGNILAWNNGAQAIFHYGEAEMLGESLTRLMPERSREAHQRGLEHLHSTGESRLIGRTVQLQGLRKDGSEFPLELALSSWQAGENTFYSGIIRDITVRQQAEEAIRTLNDALAQRVAELKAANQDLEALSYSIAHDLRAPLRAMHSYSHILLEDHASQLDGEAQGYLQRVSANALRMGRLIDDLLAFGQLSHKPLQKRPVALADLVREVLEDLRPEYAHRQVELAIGELPVCQADPALLKEVWANLLGNALKFTHGRPVARIEVGSQQQAGERVYFVRDNGVGFEMQYAAKLFGVFQRLHRMEDYEGTGVGLALTHRIVHRHGGRIWAEAAMDQGATFFFTVGP